MDLRAKFVYFLNNWVDAKKKSYKENKIEIFFRNNLKNDLENFVHEKNSALQVKASVGAGLWADVAWISILDPAVTETTQDGLYPVYLFCSDGSGFYLSLNQGTTIPTKTYGKQQAEKRAQAIQDRILRDIPEINFWPERIIDLKPNTDLSRSYEKFNIAAKFYSLHSIPSNEELIYDLVEMVDLYKKVKESILNKNPEKLVRKKNIVSNKITLPKPFLLLAGISGTGKSRFVREQAKAWDASLETYCLVSVRPDWHEPSDLMGYVSRLGQRPQYVATDVLRFMVRAWQEVIESVKRDDQGRPVRWLGRDLDQIRPFWLCLDEMNLAPVEQYFADYLSVLETRSWTYAEPSEATSYSYSCDPLIKGSVFSSLDVGMTDDDLKPSDLLAQDLGLNLELPLDKDIWDLFLQEGIGIPFNLIVAGTVNMDETTHGFSRKVIDRALSFDFGDFFPNNFEQFFEPAVFNKILTYPTQSHADRSTLSTTIDSDGALSIQFLGKVNEVLKGTPFELAYRALNELLLAVMSAQPKDEATLQAVWDDFLMCKVLPRLEGDIDKLGGAHSLLEQLEEVLPVELDSIWSPSTESATRPDLYREYKVTDSDSVMTSSEVLIACRTRAKLGWMRKRLESSGFTSFWP